MKWFNQVVARRPACSVQKPDLKPSMCKTMAILARTCLYRRGLRESISSVYSLSRAFSSSTTLHIHRAKPIYKQRKRDDDVGTGKLQGSDMASVPAHLIPYDFGLLQGWHSESTRLLRSGLIFFRNIHYAYRGPKAIVSYTTYNPSKTRSLPSMEASQRLF